jgi:two-component system, cell cycle sensor histidine kinase and response regulator CckA
VAATSNIRLGWDRQLEISPIPLEALPFPAAIADLSGNVRVGNREWLARYGDSIGSAAVAWFEQYHPDQEMQSAFRSAMPAVGAFSVDCGTHRVTGSPIPNGILLGISGFPRAEEEAKRAGHAQKMETVGRLASGVAHDFANILTLIAGYTDILLNQVNERDPAPAELEEIRKAANRGARLTSQLLGYTRGQSVQPRAVDLNTLILDLQRMLRPIIGENVEWQAAMAPDLRKVVVDPGQMEQVVMNLILNARDAMPTGGRISIETANSYLDENAARQHEMAPGECVLISIADSGHGIDAESMQHIFEPFFTTKAKGKGTGLGLSTVFSIVREAGGDIWVESPPGAGAMFTICLHAGKQTPEVSDAAPAPRTARGSETILLVEDEDGVRKLLNFILSRRGYQVLEAASGEDALAIFEQRGHEVHLVLTDMVMPKMSGRQLAERLRQARPDLPVIYMSGYTDDVLVKTGALGPGMSFLQKPLRPDVLAAKVREALDSPSRPFNP